MKYSPGLTSCAHIKNALSVNDLDYLSNYALSNLEPFPFRESTEEANDERKNIRVAYKFPIENPSIDYNVENILRKIWGHIQLANEIYNFNINSFIDFNYFEYPKHESYLDWHMDLGNVPNADRRKLSFSIFINSWKEYEGGNLEIFSDNKKPPKSIQGETGDLIIFPSYLMHQVSPITKGTRKVIVGFVGGNEKFR